MVCQRSSATQRCCKQTLTAVLPRQQGVPAVQLAYLMTVTASQQQVVVGPLLMGMHPKASVLMPPSSEACSLPAHNPTATAVA